MPITKNIEQLSPQSKTRLQTLLQAALPLVDSLERIKPRVITVLEMPVGPKRSRTLESLTAEVTVVLDKAIPLANETREILREGHIQPTSIDRKNPLYPLIGLASSTTAVIQALFPFVDGLLQRYRPEEPRL